MRLLTPAQLATLNAWFLPDRPGPLIGLHVIQTGHGRGFVDRWPDPRAVLVETAQNMALSGDPTALQPDDLRIHAPGFVEAADNFVPLLRAAFPDLVARDRIIYALVGKPQFSLPTNFTVRQLGPTDAQALQKLSDESSWISKTWGGPDGLAASGYAWGAFANDQLAAVANIFFLGDHYEDIGVATEPQFRGYGLSGACAGALCEEIQARGHTPCWSTSPDNLASKRVAEKLGFTWQRNDYLYVAGIEAPKPAQPALI
ncbi:MAG: GNAT family N-acetyltransferase [Chloroflexi bacterium]|nr:GNAT family N-acetyltransferase [Chloroflexota bacterium]